MTGTFINVGTVLTGTLLGTLVGRRLNFLPALVLTPATVEVAELF